MATKIVQIKCSRLKLVCKSERQKCNESMYLFFDNTFLLYHNRIIFHDSLIFAIHFVPPNNQATTISAFSLLYTIIF